MAGNATCSAPTSSATRSDAVWQAASNDAGSACAAYTGPTVWITQSAGRLPPVVATASPVGRPPPYRDVYSYEPIMLYAPEAYAYDRSGNDEGAGGSFENLDVPEFSLVQKAHTLNAVLDTWDALYPRMQGVDLRRDVPRLEVPVYFVQGAHEMRGLAVLFAPWYAELAAPAKQLTVVPTGGHRAIFEQPALFARVMDEVLAQTRAAPGR